VLSHSSKEGNQIRNFQMGSYFSVQRSKPDDIDMETQLFRGEHDKSLVGDVYLVMYKQGSELNTTVIKQAEAHFSLVVDVAGDCTVDSLDGFEMHLIANKLTKITSPMSNRRTRPMKTFMNVIKLGKIENRFHSQWPLLWAEGMQEMNEAKYIDFINEMNAGNLWSARVNCQQYARYMANFLGVCWPDDVSVVGDMVPAIIDLTIFSANSRKSVRTVSKYC